MEQSRGNVKTLEHLSTELQMLEKQLRTIGMLLNRA
jgi:hypothetical protein